jgi:hypothetical protein
MHRDVYVKTNGQAVHLAKEMMLIDPIVTTAEEVACCIAESIEKGYFELASVNSKMLGQLAKAGAIRMRDRGAQAATR